MEFSPIALLESGGSPQIGNDIGHNGKMDGHGGRKPKSIIPKTNLSCGVDRPEGRSSDWQKEENRGDQAGIVSLEADRLGDMNDRSRR